MFMDFLIPAKQRYYSKDNSEKILKKLSEAINEVTLSSRHELLCLFDGILSTTPCCYWDKSIYSQVISKLETLPQQNFGMIIDEMAMEHFLIGYGTYKQVTDIINDLSGLNDSPEIKNRQYRIPTYISIVEGCLTNLFRFIALLLNQTTTKDYSSAYKLSPLCDILNSNDLSCATQHIDIDIRNAINHGGVIFKEDGRTIDFHYMKNHNSVSRTLQVYEFDRLIEQVYDTASAVLLSLSVFLNNHWDLVSIDLSQKSFMSFALFSLELSIPHCKCRYIFDIPNNKQLNADFYITNTDRTFILQTAVELAIIIFTRYGDYDQYYFSFSGERLQTSWVRFTNKEIADMTTRKREITDVIQNALKRKDIIIFDPSTEEVNLQEIKYFRFPNYESDDFKITNIEDGSLPDRKRLRCQLYIGDITDKGRILEIIRESIEWLKTVKNVDSPTLHHKNGTMEPDSLYINVYRHDARKNKGLFPNNENFVCFVDYNLSGFTTLKNGGIPPKIWAQFYHEKINQLDIAWREGKYIIRHAKKIGANELCPCGSGKKFKKCCRGKGIYD